MNNARQERIPEFDTLRGLLAWWVVSEHVRNEFPIAIPDTARSLIAAGNAVNLFILLSGFVIFLLLDGKRESYAAFIVRRFFRLWPVFVVCLLCSLPLTGLGPTRNAVVIFLSNLTLLHGLIPETWCPAVTTTVLPPSWSISLEWQFYLVAPLLYFLACRKRGMLLGALAINVAIYYAVRGPAMFVYPSFLPFRLHLFLLGAFCYFTWRWAPTIHVSNKLPSSLILAGLVFLVTHETWLVIWTGVFSYILFRRMSSEGSENSRNGFTRFTRRLGTISYSTYLCHFPVILALERLFRSRGWLTHPPLTNFTIMFAAVAIVTLLASWLLHTIVEVPAMEWGRGLANRLNASRLESN
jgi:peptidoglycan/LPS O-acetylase OafA/YrhL